jgi:hypothetical protein
MCQNVRIYKRGFTLKECQGYDAKPVLRYSWLNFGKLHKYYILN